MLGFYPIGGDATAGLGANVQLIVPFTDANSGGFVAGSSAGTESDRWHTERIPMIWTTTGGAICGGIAVQPARWTPEGGAWIGGKALYPLRMSVTGGAVMGGTFVMPYRILGSGGALFSGGAIHTYGLGVRIGGGCIMGGNALFGFASARFVHYSFTKVGRMVLTETTQRLRRVGA